ncbi:unnamed protein product, partial [Gordionus sp. m RMFG-2023]
TKEVIEILVAENPLESRLTIYDKAMQIRCSECLDIAEYPEAIPSFVSFKTTIDRILKKYRPVLPYAVEEIILTPEFTLTMLGEQFLIYSDNNKLIMFGTASMLRLAERADNIYMDGTFYSAPSLYYQLYVIHVMFQTVMIPIVYALLPNKNKKTYIKVFRVLVEFCAENNIWFNPSMAQTDYEIAAISALKDVFTTMSIKGCYFHYSQALWRKCQTLGLSGSYMGHSDVHKVVRRVSTLPFCREEHVALVRDTCYQMAANDTLLSSFMMYMDTIWLGDRPPFPYTLWSRHRVAGPRTNNHLEGFHHALNLKISYAHPNIYTLLKILINYQNINDLKLIQISNGSTVNRINYAYEIKDRKIANLTDIYEGTEDVLTFLDEISKIVKLKC